MPVLLGSLEAPQRHDNFNMIVPLTIKFFHFHILCGLKQNNHTINLKHLGSFSTKRQSNLHLGLVLAVCP